MAKWYSLYILTCGILFVSMQFHWYGKRASTYKKHHKILAQASQNHAFFTKKLHKTVSLTVQIREKIEAFNPHNIQQKNT